MNLRSGKEVGKMDKAEAQKEAAEQVTHTESENTQKQSTISTPTQEIGDTVQSTPTDTNLLGKIMEMIGQINSNTENMNKKLDQNTEIMNKKLNENNNKMDRLEENINKNLRNMEDKIEEINENLRRKIEENNVELQGKIINLENKVKKKTMKK